MEDLLLGFLGVTFAKENNDSVRDCYFFPFLMIKDLSKLAGEDDTDDIEA